jgi:predicted phage terminase large subunit-like protein
MNEQLLVNAILRSDFKSFLYRCMLVLNPGATFLPNWHIDGIAFRLDQVRGGEITRLIINLPPRYLKSLMVSVVFPAFLLGHNPRLKIFGISYGTELSAKHAADFRTIVESGFYRRAFPNMVVQRAANSDVFTTKRGFRRSTSVSAALTGLGGDIFIIDDPQKPEDAQSETLRNGVNQWFSNTLRSRLDNKERGVIIVVMQRVHQYDLTGHLTENSNDWSVLNLAALAEEDEQIAVGEGKIHLRRAGEALHPEYESRATLEKLRHELGSEIFAAQYQQSPVPPGGAVIRKDWLRYYDSPPERTFQTKIIQSWDTAAKEGAKNDWSVCTTWLVADKRDYYLLDLTRGRFEYPQLKQTAIALAQRFKPTYILIEDASTGIALAQELRAAGTFVVKAVPIHRDKLTRLWLQQAKFEAGVVYFPRDAPWLSILEAELLAFPQVKHDDQADSISQALAYEMSGYDTTMGWANYL